MRRQRPVARQALVPTLQTQDYVASKVTRMGIKTLLV
jgi:hypothetical protein